MSPLCFAIAAGLLLRRIHRILLDATIRAYADDLAIVLRSGFSGLRILIDIFNEYALVSGLQLNLPKTVYVPWDTTDPAIWKEQIAKHHPVWATMQVAHKAKYLGFFVGPDRGTHTFYKPINNFLQRAKDWSYTGCGLVLTLVAYSVYILPVMLFVTQLDSPPSSWEAVEKTAIRRLLPGPGNWCDVEALRALPCFGFPKGFADLNMLTNAIQYRVAANEATADGGLQVVERAFNLRCLVSAPSHPLRKATWDMWFKSSFLVQLARSTEYCRSRGLHPPVLENQLSNKAARPYEQQVAKTIKARWQKTVWKAICPDHTPDLRIFLRKRLDRWDIFVLPGHRVARAINTLHVLDTMVPHRVKAALIRTQWNGWLIARRLQKSGPLRDTTCCFGCSLPDPIEHYARCQHVSTFAWSFLRLPRAQTPQERLSDFLLLGRPRVDNSADLLRRKALRTATVYRAQHVALPS